MKCAAYARVSTEEQASAIEGSLDNQQYRLKAFVDLKQSQEKTWGKVVELYIDDGFSAKDTRRPAYQRMMVDLKRKKIDLILVSDISRLSRNIFDFSSLMKDLENLSAQFLSIKEQFDTSTPAGKMMIYNLINLAQFEREQVSERVALGAHARAMRGLLNGSRPILGFDKHPDKPGSYVVNDVEASQVRRIFRHFLNCGSRAKTIQVLDREGIKPKSSGKNGSSKGDEKWNAQTLGTLLSSAAYIGSREVNRSNKHKDQHKLKSYQQYKIVKATWPAIVSKDDYINAQALLEEAQKLERARLKEGEDRVYFLSAILRCGECGSPLVGQASHGHSAVHRYYGHTKAYSKTNCSIHRIPAGAAEEAVLAYLWEGARDAGYLQKIEKNIKEMRNIRSLDSARDKRVYRDEVTNVQTKIDNLLLMQGRSMLPDVLKQITKTFEALCKEKTDLEEKLSRLDQVPTRQEVASESTHAIGESLREFERGFRKATSAMKKRLLRKVLKQVVVTPKGLSIFMHLADGVEIPNHQLKLVKVSGSKNEQNPPIALARKASGDVSKLSVVCSDIDKDGDPGLDRTGDLQFRKPLLYPTELPGHKSDEDKDHQNIFDSASMRIQFFCAIFWQCRSAVESVGKSVT